MHVNDRLTLSGQLHYGRFSGEFRAEHWEMLPNRASGRSTWPIAFGMGKRPEEIRGSTDAPIFPLNRLLVTLLSRTMPAFQVAQTATGRSTMVELTRVVGRPNDPALSITCSSKGYSNFVQDLASYLLLLL